MNEAIFFLCEPVKFLNGIYVYPPKVKEIVQNNKFSIYKQILTMSQEEIEDTYINQEKILKDVLTPLEFLFFNIYNDSEGRIKQLAEEAFKFFLHEPVTFLLDQKMIIVGDLTEEVKKVDSIKNLRIINEDNFFDFQNLIRESCGDKKIEKPNLNEHPKLREMKAKARYRDRIKAKKGNGLSLKTLLVSICCMGIGITPLNIGELSYASVPILMRHYQEKEKYNVDIQSLMAGAKAKDVKLKYWIRNIEE